MSSNSKRQKLYKELNARQRRDLIGTPFRKRFEDRLTNLPSSLKTKILSCLPTKDAVRTSILSTKWKRSWTSITSLDFDDCLVRSPEDEDYSVASPADDNYGIIFTHNFTSFVNRVLLLRDRSCLQRFRLNCNGYHEGSLINAWIAAALLCDVKELDVSVPIKDQFLLPCYTFLCKTLVVLKLDTRGYVNMPALVCLPDLKTLHLSDIELSDDMAIVSLLSGCPVLEELQLRRCIGKDVRIINIIAPSLTSLTIEALPYRDDEPVTNYNYQVVVDTPALKYLKFSDYAVQGYALKNLNYLIKAEINVGAPYEDRDYYTDQYIEFNSKHITDFFIGISQVQSLVLSTKSMEVIYSSDLCLPTFNNLTYMKLNTLCRRYLPKLLENSPRLETLHLQQGFEYERCFPINYAPPSCLLSHLRVIKIDEFEGLEYEMEMVEFFLEHAKVLEKLTIDYQYSNWDTKGDTMFFKKLLMMPRSSTVCKVEVL